MDKKVINHLGSHSQWVDDKKKTFFCASSLKYTFPSIPALDYRTIFNPRNLFISNLRCY